MIKDERMKEKREEDELDLMYELVNQIKTNSEIANQKIGAELMFDSDKLFDIKPYLVAYNMTSTSDILTKRKKENKPIKNWDTNNSLAMLYYYANNGTSSFEYSDMIMFYAENDVVNEIDSLTDDKYIILGIKKPKTTNNPKLDALFNDAKITTWEVVDSIEDMKNVITNISSEDMHIFRISDNVTLELLEKFKKASEIMHYQVEKNCFDMTDGADNNGKFKVYMKGDIIITDPCYLIRKRDESTRPKWKDFHPYSSIYEYPDYNQETKTSDEFTKNSKLLEEADKEWCKEHPDDRDSWDEMDLSNFGINTYITHNTLYGDWGCHTFSTDTKEVLGQFCADGGEVGVFLLNEVLNYNPDFKDYMEHPYAVTWIKNFDGYVWFEKLDSETLIVKGEGNINFFTRQTGL